MTDEEIRRTTIGEPRVQEGPVELSEYHPAWPSLFQREERRIRAALGELVMRLEHVGSTSVPGLAAKPIIDMDLVVADSADEPSYVPPLESAGYVLHARDPDWHQHRLFYGPDTPVHLHVLSEGSLEIERDVLFRDRLRSDEADRELYERTKRELAGRRWKYLQNYADAKSPVIDEIIARAAAETGVGRDSASPGPPDGP